MLIVEDGSGKPDADSYVSVEDAQAYAQARGLDFDASPESDLEAALRRATSWLDGTYRTRFPGRRKKGRAQALEWPRIDAEDIEGEPIADDEVPVEIVHATIEAAVRELAAPGSLSPDYVASERVKSEQVGPLAVTYMDGSGTAEDVMPIVTVIDGILSLLFSTGRAAAIFGEAVRR